MKARLYRRGLATIVAVLLTFAPLEAWTAPAGLSDSDAVAHFERAQQHFNDEDYAAAIPELKAAYALEPNPMLLYAWAQAERLAGSCSRAAELYRRFLDTEPAQDQRQLAEANLVDCEAEPEPEELEPDELEPDELEPDAMNDDETPLRPWYLDRAGGAMMGVGLASVIGGGVLMAVARGGVRDAGAAQIQQDHIDAESRARRNNTVGIIVLGVGSGLVVGGAIRYAILEARGRTRSEEAALPRWRLVFTRTGLGMRGRF